MYIVTLREFSSSLRTLICSISIKKLVKQLNSLWLFNSAVHVQIKIRFGLLVRAETTDDEATKKARLERFGSILKPYAVEEDKEKARGYPTNIVTFFITMILSHFPRQSPGYF